MTKAHWILACFLVTLCALHGGSGGPIPTTQGLNTDIEIETEVMETLTTVAAIGDPKSTQSPSHTSVPQASSNPAAATTQTISTAAPTTIQPTTVSPAVIATTTPTITTSSAPTTQKVTTPPPTTQKVTTPPPTTQKVTTRPPTTQKVTTPPPTTQKVTTPLPTTQKVTTPPPTTQKVTTPPPVTQKATTSTQASTSKLGELTTTTTTTQPATVSGSGKSATDSQGGDWSIIGITGKSFTGKILLPIAIGIAFSVIIIAVAYFYCSRKRPSLRSKPTSSRNGVHDMTSNDRVMLLADSSEDEF